MEIIPYFETNFGTFGTFFTKLGTSFIKFGTSELVLPGPPSEHGWVIISFRNP